MLKSVRGILPPRRKHVSESCTIHLWTSALTGNTHSLDNRTCYHLRIVPGHSSFIDSWKRLIRSWRRTDQLLLENGPVRSLYSERRHCLSWIWHQHYHLLQELATAQASSLLHVRLRRWTCVRQYACRYCKHLRLLVRKQCLAMHLLASWSTSESCRGVERWFHMNHSEWQVDHLVRAARYRSNLEQQSSGATWEYSLNWSSRDSCQMP